MFVEFKTVDGHTVFLNERSVFGIFFNKDMTTPPEVMIGDGQRAYKVEEGVAEKLRQDLYGVRVTKGKK